MLKNKVIFIQVWIGEIPEYFWYHYETTKNLKGFDFLFFTDQNLILDSPNYTVLKTNKESLEDLLSVALKKEIQIKSNKKICDLKASYGEIFADYIKGYDYYGVYDIDTLFGDVYEMTKDLLYRYDVISVADEIFHNRLSGPFLLFRNDGKLNYEYNCEEYVKCFDNEEVECFEENVLPHKLKDRYKIKYIYSINCETENGGKNTYNCFWSGGKVFVEGKEKLIYHFYRKNQTKLTKIGNLITAQYKKILLEDFYWVISFTQNYEKLFDNLLKSIKKYSNRKCVIYSINYNYTPSLEYISDEQFIIRRIDIPEGDKDVRGRDNNIISSKPLINLDVINHFPNKKFVTIDSDIYFTVNSDDIKKYFSQLDYYPLINSHIHEVIYLNNIHPNEEWTSPLHLLLDEMGVKEFVVPRRKTNVVIFDERSRWFFNEQMKIYNQYRGSRPGILSLHDEDTANAILSKYSLKKCLPLVDIEEVSNIDMEVFHKYSYNMTPISEFVILPKNENEVLFFHGIKSQEHYDKIKQNYDRDNLECEELYITYKNNSIFIERNSFLTTKNLPDKVDFKIYTMNGEMIFSLNEQQIKHFHLFYVNNFHLTSNFYEIKMLNSSNGICIFRDIFQVK